MYVKTKILCRIEPNQENPILQVRGARSGGKESGRINRKAVIWL